MHPRDKYTAALAGNMFQKLKQKARDNEERARDARIRLQGGMTVAHLGTYRFSMPAVLGKQQQRTAATKFTGIGKAVDLSMQPDLQANEESTSQD